MRNRMIKRIAAVAMVAAMTFTVAPTTIPQVVIAEAATKTVKLSKKSLKITDFKGYRLSIKNVPKNAKISWSISGGKNSPYAFFNIFPDKKTVMVDPKQNGSGTITCKVNKKKYTCKFTVAIPTGKYFDNVVQDINKNGGMNHIIDMSQYDLSDVQEIGSPDDTIHTTLFGGTGIDLKGNLDRAVPKSASDTIIFGFDGNTSYNSQEYVERTYFTLNRDGKIQYLFSYINGGGYLMTVSLKDGASVNASDFTKKSAPSDLLDKLQITDYGGYGGTLADKTDVTNTLMQILKKTDEGMLSYYRFGLSSIGFSNYK